MAISSTSYEIRTQSIYSAKLNRHESFVMRVNILPRGSANKPHATRVAQAFRADAELAEHVQKIVVRSSAVLVYFNPSKRLGVLLACRNALSFVEASRSTALEHQPMLPGFSIS